jgi:hypothetical protein
MRRSVVVGRTRYVVDFVQVPGVQEGRTQCDVLCDDGGGMTHATPLCRHCGEPLPTDAMQEVVDELMKLHPGMEVQFGEMEYICPDCTEKDDAAKPPVE